MGVPTPQEGSARWVRNLQGATERMRAGAEAVTQSPGVAAAAKRQEWLAKVQASQEKWARNSAKVTTEGWRQAYIEKGLSRVGPGAQAAQPKYEEFASRFYPLAAQVSSEVRAMPKLTFEDSIQRVRRTMERFKAFGDGRRQ